MTALVCGAIYGDGLADRGLGMGGGGISAGGAISFRASGETESSESVIPVVDDEEVCIMGVGRSWGSWLCSTLSARSLSTWAFMLGVVAVLLRSGFDIGDCLMPDFALALAAFLRIFLARSPGVELCIGWAFDESSSISTGELVVTTLCI